MKVDGGIYRLAGFSGILAEHRGYDSGEDVSTSTLGHARIASGIDCHASIRVSNDRAPTLKHQGHLVFRGKFPRHIFTIRLYLLNAQAGQPGHFARMRREHQEPSAAIQTYLYATPGY